MAFDPKLYRDNTSGVGMPADEKATDSTSDWTSVSLLKAIFGALASGVVVTGNATAARQDTGNTSLASLDTKMTTLHGYVDGLESQTGIVTEVAPASDTASSGLNGRLQRIAQRLSSLIALVPASLGQKTMTASLAVTLPSDDPLTVLQSASSATVTALASAATSAQLLAANAARKGLILNNSDANAVLVKYGTTASATSYTVRIPLNGYWEMPKPIYTGRIDAIWEADGSGSLYATEM